MSTSREQSTRSSSMAALQCYVFSWSHEGRREGLFLEATAMQRIHLIRRTRRGNIRWGSHGTWRLFMIRGQPVLQLDNFQYCPQAHVRHLTFTVDPRNRGFMVDQHGRVIRFLGRLSMVIFAGPQRAPSLPDTDDWVSLWPFSRVSRSSGREGPGIGASLGHADCALPDLMHRVFSVLLVAKATSGSAM